MIKWFVPLLVVACAFAQEGEPALSPAEKEFQQSMSGVTLDGHFTRQDGTSLVEETYGIEKITKLKGDLWRFDARMRFGGHDLKLPVELEVKWAGDTPVLTMTDKAFSGLGTYTVRIVVFRGQYAGTWSSGKGHGGMMFGSIVKSAPSAK